MPKLPRFPPWKRDPETETMLKEIRQLQQRYLEKHPAPPLPPSPFDPGGVAESIAEGIMLAPFAILYSPIIIGMAIKEALEERLRPKEEIAESLKYWRKRDRKKE